MAANPGGAGMTTDQLRARYLGTGDADQTATTSSKYAFLTQQHRDTYASHVGHYDQLSYLAVAQNVSMGRLRLTYLERMGQPCGPRPPTKDVDKLVEKYHQNQSSAS